MEEKALFEISVPYNHEMISSARKKQSKKISISVIISSLTTIGGTILAIRSNSVPMIAIFAALSAMIILAGIILLCRKPASPKNAVKSTQYRFYAGYLLIEQVQGVEKNVTKRLESCLYRPYKNKHYVWKICEFSTHMELTIVTGTINGVPKTALYVIPKNVMPPEVLNALILFLKANIGQDYISKV